MPPFSRSRTALAVLAIGVHSLAAQKPALIPIPVRSVADRFFATPITAKGDTLSMLLDSGGGVEFVPKAALARMGFTLKFMMVADGDSVFGGGAFPEFRRGSGVPVPLHDSSLYGAVMPAGDGPLSEADGMLGNDWFAGRVWVLDYPGHAVGYFESPPPPRGFDAHTIPMTTKQQPRMNHPRIRVVIAGDTIDVLLDTGASSSFTADALAAAGGPRTRGSAFVSARLFDKWRAAHPVWRFVAHGETTGSDLIEVPSIRIAGFDTGPVWFAKRNNSVYDGMMRRVMDQPIEASIGGPALKTFRITMDYVNQRATFETR